MISLIYTTHETAAQKSHHKTFSTLGPRALVEADAKLLDRKGYIQKGGEVNKHPKTKALHSKL